MSKLQSRRLQQADLDTLRRWRMDPEVTKYLLSDPIITREDQIQWFKQLQQNRNSIYWIISFYGLDIGYAALSNIDLKNKTAHPRVYIAEIGYRGRGFATSIIATLQRFAFRHFPLHKLCAQILSTNYPALIAYLKNGWTIEGLLKAHIFKDKFHDVYNLALFKGDYLK